MNLIRDVKDLQDTFAGLMKEAVAEMTTCFGTVLVQSTVSWSLSRFFLSVLNQRMDGQGV